MLRLPPIVSVSMWLWINVMILSILGKYEVENISLRKVGWETHASLVITISVNAARVLPFCEVHNAQQESEDDRRPSSASPSPGRNRCIAVPDVLEFTPHLPLRHEWTVAYSDSKCFRFFLACALLRLITDCITVHVHLA